MGAAIIKYPLIFTAGLGSCIVILVLLFHNDGGRSIDSLTSPDGTTIVEKINCGAEVDDYRISVRGTPGNCQDDNNNIIRIRNANSVGFVWLDNGHLLVAAPNLDYFDKRPDRINNIAITYSVYPLTEPTAVRDSKVVSVSNVPIVANYKFRSTGVKLYLGCNLFVSAYLTGERKEVGLRVYVQKNVKTKAWSAGQIIEIPESANAYLQFSSLGDFEFPGDWGHGCDDA